MNWLRRGGFFTSLAVTTLLTVWLLRGGLPAGSSFADSSALSGAPRVMVAKPRHSATDFQAGVMVLVYGNDPAAQLKTVELLNRIARLGVNSVGFVFSIYQDDWTSSAVHSDGLKTSSVEAMRLLIQQAHDRGFSVILRPLLDEQSFLKDGQWRGSIRPRNLDQWFASYEGAITPYAKMAQAEKVEVFDVGTEFSSLESQGPHWLQVIGSVRKVYQGQITFSLNWSDSYPSGFGQALDFISVDAFYPLDAPVGANASQLATAWGAWDAKLADLRRAAGKPVVFTELGTTSEAGSYRAPYAWTNQSPVDMGAQQSYYRASCQAVKGMLAGMYFWEMSPYPPADPAADNGFDPTGKPAELEISTCFRSSGSLSLSDHVLGQAG